MKIKRKIDGWVIHAVGIKNNLVELSCGEGVMSTCSWEELEHDYEVVPEPGATFSVGEIEEFFEANRNEGYTYEESLSFIAHKKDGIAATTQRNKEIK